jgi:hypothetical protein
VIAFLSTWSRPMAIWVMLRVSDPSEPVDASATGEHARPDRRIASTSPSRWTRLPGP